MAGGDLLAYELPDFVGAIVGDAAGDDGGAAGRHFVEDADVEVAVEGQGQGARDGSGGHDQDVGLAESCRALLGRRTSLSAGGEGVRPYVAVAASIVCGFLHQLEALHHAEAVLFVDDHQAQLGELDFLLDQGVGSDDQLRVALGDVAADFAFAIFFDRAGQQHDPVSGILQNSAGGKIMLLGQNFGGRHERDLVSVFHGDDGGLEGHDGLARSDVALQQSPHGEGLFHVGGDFLEHALLGRRGMEGQNLLDGLPHPIVQAERDSGLRLLLAALEFEPQFQKEEFFKDQPDMGRGARGLQVLEAFAGIGPVHLPQRLARRDQAQVAAHGGWNRVGEFRRKILQHSVDDAAKPAGVRRPCPADS